METAENRITAFIMAMLVALSSIFFSTGIVHAEQQVTSYACIKADYSSGINPASGDRFEITYKRNGGQNTAKITLNADEVCSELGGIPLPPGQYLITKIAYKGQNASVEKEGYAVSSSFTSSIKGGTTIQLAIGKDACQKLVSRYGDVVASASAPQPSYENDSSSDDDSSSDSQSADTSDSSSDDGDTDGIMGNSSDDSMNEPKKKEDSSRKTKKKKEPAKKSGGSVLSSVLGRGAFILILSAMGFGIIYFLYQKGYI
jgi:hypothetical protein